MKLGVNLALHLVKDPDRRFRLWNYAKKKMSKYDFETSPWVREMVCPMRSAQFKYPRDKFDEPVFLDFEGHKLPAHHYYRDYLENVYKGYMELPPVEQRIPKTRAIYINLDKGYRFYRGIKYLTEGNK
jgi:lipopolysaccharide cholinephosphotransferase